MTLYKSNKAGDGASLRKDKRSLGSSTQEWKPATLKAKIKGLLNELGLQENLAQSYTEALFNLFKKSTLELIGEDPEKTEDVMKVGVLDYPFGFYLGTLNTKHKQRKALLAEVADSQPGGEVSSEHSASQRTSKVKSNSGEVKS